ncbi:zinc finger protein 425 [Plutella xylostella]|uniref:zinc finger protein 425 n=1 Tax=Plutella xylostella TaxID=51655 RepID=UPI002032B705|nr:zinc finger protein 425 [Plutella xylostella]
METDIKATNLALKYLCGETENVCRLCLSSTSSYAISTESVINLKKHFFEEAITYNDIFIELGIPLEEELPKVLCRGCATSLVQGYTFHKLCQYSNERWTIALEHIENGFSETENLNPSAQSLYMIINKTENIVFTSRKKCNKNKKRNALNKIRKIFKNRENFNQFNLKNKNKYHGTDNYCCSQCGKTFISNYLLSKHLRYHAGRHACPKCAKVFPTEAKVKDHIDRIHQPKNIQCPQCGKFFSTKKILQFHEQLYHVPAQCALCSMEFPSKYALRVHMDKHEPNKCVRCKKVYLNRNTYRFHLKICGNQAEKEPRFYCDICGKGYVRKNGIRTHLKVCHGFGSVFSCSWCDKKFDAMSRLKNHTVKHTRERNFSCDICSGKFVTAAALVYHKRLHTGEKPFKCDMCDESFLSASRRMEHRMRKHFKPTKECKTCHMKFVMRHQLKKHEERHSNPHSKLYVPGAVWTA